MKNLSRIAQDAIEPIHHNNCWECPLCHTSNEPPKYILTSMPPQTPYYCMNCNYRYHWSPEPIVPEYPIGEVIATDSNYDAFGVYKENES